MLRLSKLTDYAIVVMTTLGRKPKRVHSAAEVAAESHLEPPTAAKLLKQLGKADLVESFRGARGGYRLARPAAEISIADVIVAMEGPIGITECSVHAGLCGQENLCALRSNWRRISRAVEVALSEVTLADMSAPLPDVPRIAPMRVGPDQRLRDPHS